jgi:hypothetical protein
MFTTYLLFKGNAIERVKDRYQVSIARNLESLVASSVLRIVTVDRGWTTASRSVSQLTTHNEIRITTMKEGMSNRMIIFIVEESRTMIVVLLKRVLSKPSLKCRTRPKCHFTMLDV